MINHVLIEAFIVSASKRPARELSVVVAERVHDYGVLVSKFDALGGNRLFDAFAGLARHHQRIGRDLTGIELHEQIHVTLKHFKILAAETEDHVHIGRRKKLECFLQTFVNESAGAELVIAFGHLEDVVIEALHTDAHAVYEPLEIAERGRGDLKRVGFARHFLDAGEKRASVFDRANEFVFENCRRAPADVHAREVVAERLHVVHFLAQIDEVFARLVFLEEETMECAV